MTIEHYSFRSSVPLDLKKDPRKQAVDAIKSE